MDEKNKIRKIVIETDGTKWSIVQKEASLLELKEIAREILKTLGG